jgi:lysozyme
MPQATASGRPFQALVVALCAALLFALVAVLTPAGADGATSMKQAKCGANLRSSASVSSRLRATIRKDARVTVVASVKGGRWSVTCAGSNASGRTWYRISGINGKSVRTTHGTAYLYAAAGLFKPWVVPPVTRYAVATGTRITAVGTVTGGSWNTTCGTARVWGPHWYKISHVDGRTARSLYGVDYVYGATGLFRTSAPSGTPPSPTPDPPAPTPRIPRTLEGIDASHWQDTIDWTRVAAAGKKFAFLKATEDTWYVDPTYPTNRAQAKAAGLKVGAYHFAQPNTDVGSATAQADHFLTYAGPVSGELRPVIDLERTGGMSDPQLIAWVREYLQRIYDRTGVRAIIYCSPNFWRTNMSDTTWFAQNGYDVLWVAHWTTATTPSLPATGWSSRGWTFWQYTSDGSVPGIQGRVDLNRFNGTDLTRVLIP